MLAGARAEHHRLQVLDEKFAFLSIFAHRIILGSSQRSSRRASALLLSATLNSQ